MGTQKIVRFTAKITGKELLDWRISRSYFRESKLTELEKDRLQVQLCRGLQQNSSYVQIMTCQHSAPAKTNDTTERAMNLPRSGICVSATKNTYIHENHMSAETVTSLGPPVAVYTVNYATCTKCRTLSLRELRVPCVFTVNDTCMLFPAWKWNIFATCQNAAHCRLGHSECPPYFILIKTIDSMVYLTLIWYLNNLFIIYFENVQTNFANWRITTDTSHTIPWNLFHLMHEIVTPVSSLHSLNLSTDFILCHVFRITIVVVNHVCPNMFAIL